MAERKDRMALLSRYNKLYLQRYEQKSNLNLNVEQWASDAEIKGLQKIDPNGSFENTTRLKHMITSINGKADAVTIRDFVDNYLLAPDSRALKKYYNEISPDIDTVVTLEKDGYVQEGVNIPIGINFFWPDA